MVSMNNKSLRELDAIKEKTGTNCRTRSATIRKLIHAKWVEMRKKEGLEGAKRIREEM